MSIRSLFASLAIGVFAGGSSALFLWALGLATDTRSHHTWLVVLLPIAGALMGLALERVPHVQGGSNAVIDANDTHVRRLSFALAPAALLGTLWTHLFGGSAGREGSAVQMAASFADAWSKYFKSDEDERRHLLAAGVAGGFAAVFGTPFAGVVFGAEVWALGGFRLRSMPWMIVSAFVGDRVARLLGASHSEFPQQHAWPSPANAFGVLALALLCALVTVVYVELTHWIARKSSAALPRLPFRMAVGGALVGVLWFAVGQGDYLGLGVPMIESAFHRPADESAFAIKLLLTAVTIGFGFWGGEVTPLFFVGATLGSALAQPLGLSTPLAAGLAMTAVFGAAANTPLALAVMGAELLGWEQFPLFLLVNLIAYTLTGHRGIYPSQRVFRDKLWRRCDGRALISFSTSAAPPRPPPFDVE